MIVADMQDKDYKCTLANHVMALPLFGLTECDLIHGKNIHEVDSGNSAETLTMSEIEKSYSRRLCQNASHTGSLIWWSLGVLKVCGNKYLEQCMLGYHPLLIHSAL